MAAEGSKRVIRAAFVVVPAVFLAIGIWMVVDTLRFLAAAERVEAEVIDVVVTRRGPAQAIETALPANSVGSGDIIYVYDEGYTPIVAFEVEGRRVEAPTQIEFDGYDFSIGTRLTVLYDPEDPSEVRVRGLLSLWMFPVVFTFLGGGMLVLVYFGRAQLEKQLDAM